MNKKYYLILLATIIFFFNFIFMPKEFTKGDSFAIKISAINLVSNHEFGIAPEKLNNLKGMLAIPGQYVFQNSHDQKYYSRWGFFDTILFAIPEFFVGHDKNGPLILSENSIFAHNVSNLFLSIAIGMLLFLIAEKFNDNSKINFLFVLISLYSTFIFNYLRAQSYEIWQITFFLTYFYSLLEFKQTPKTKWLILFNLALAFLMMAKIYYAVLYLPAALYLFSEKKNLKPIVLTALAGATTLGLIFLINRSQFSELVLLSKASHAPFDESIKPFSLNHIPSRLWDYLASARASVFFYFPPLLFSFMGYKTFIQKHKAESVLIIFTLVLALIPLLLFYTFGEWCYGPRFLVCFLTVLSLPFLVFLREGKKSIVVLFGFICLGSIFLQFEQSSRPFFLNYQLESLFYEAKDPLIDSYFKDIPPALIASQFNSFVERNEAFFPLEKAVEKDPQKKDQVLNGLVNYCRTECLCNYYFDSICRIRFKNPF